MVSCNGSWATGLASLAVAAASLTAQAQLYKCTDAAGRIAYQQSPCSGDRADGKLDIQDQLTGDVYSSKSSAFPTAEGASATDPRSIAPKSEAVKAVEAAAARAREGRDAAPSREAVSVAVDTTTSAPPPLRYEPTEIKVPSASGGFLLEGLLIAMIGGMVLTIVLWSRSSTRRRDTLKQLQEKLRKQRDFYPAQQFLGANGAGLAFDDKRQKLCLFSTANGLPLKFVAASDIVSASIFEDGEVITSTNRGSQLGGAIVGGALFGGVGAVIGGLSGKTTATNKVTRVELRIVINDTKRPMHDVAFMSLSDPAQSGIYYPDASQLARHWHAILAVLIRRGDIAPQDAVGTVTPQEIAATVSGSAK